MSSDLHPGWVWALSAGAILGGALTLYTARSAIGPALDRWVPKIERPAEVVAPAQPEAAAVPESEPEEPAGPEWTYFDVEAAIQPLPESAESLTSAGRGEMSQFADLGTDDEIRALVIGNRWRLWGRVWRNRVEQIRRPLPPAEACDLHAALEATCRAVRQSLELLDRVPAAGNTREAEALFDEAAGLLEALRQQPEEAEATPSSDAP